MSRIELVVVEDCRVGPALTNAVSAINRMDSAKTIIFDEGKWNPILTGEQFLECAQNIIAIRNSVLLLLDMGLNIPSSPTELQVRSAALALDSDAEYSEWQQKAGHEPFRANGFLLGLYIVKNCKAPRIEICIITEGGLRSLAERLLTRAIPHCRKDAVCVRQSAMDGLTNILSDEDKVLGFVLENVRRFRLGVDALLNLMAENDPHKVASLSAEERGKFVKEALALLLPDSICNEILSMRDYILECFKTFGALNCCGYPLSMAAGWLISLAAFANVGLEKSVQWKEIFSISDLTVGTATNPCLLPPLTIEEKGNGIRAFWDMCGALFSPRPVEKGGSGVTPLVKVAFSSGKLCFTLDYDPTKNYGGASLFEKLANELASSLSVGVPGGGDVAKAVFRFSVASAVSASPKGAENRVFWNSGRLKIERSGAGQCLVSFGG